MLLDFKSLLFAAHTEKLDFILRFDYCKELIICSQSCIWQTVLSKVTCIALWEYILSVHDYLGNSRPQQCAMLNNAWSSISLYVVISSLSNQLFNILGNVCFKSISVLMCYFKDLYTTPQRVGVSFSLVTKTK